MNISVFVAGIPKGQPRSRAFARNGHVRVYDPGTAEGWKSQVALALKPHLPEAPIANPVKLNMVFYMPRPKSHLKKSGHLLPFKEFPPRQKPASFSIDQALEMMKKGTGGSR